MPAIIAPKTVSINGNLYSTKEDVKGGWIDPFPEQQSIGDPDYSNRRDLSSWTITPPLYIGVEEMDERKDSNRCWWTNCNVQYRGHTLPPRKATSITLPINTTAATITNGNMELAANWTLGARSAVQAHGGTYSWSVGADTVAYQDAVTWTNDWRNRAFLVIGWIYGGATAPGKINLDDGVSQTSSTVVSTAAWTQVVVVRTLDAAATRLWIELENGSGGGTAYFDDVTLYYPIIGNPIFCMFNGVLYMATGNLLCKLNAGRTAWTNVAVMPTTITALIASLNSRLYIFMGDSQNYYYMSTAEAFTASNSANANKGFQSDAKSFKVNTSGTVAYSTDPDGATPTWTSGGAITDIASQIETCIPNGRDASGTTTPYIATHSILKAYDSATPKWVDTEVRLPDHPIGGRGATYFNGKMYISYGLAVKEYYPETGSLRDIGLTERDGLPAEYNGEIVKLQGDGGTKLMFAAIDASIPSGNSKSGLYTFDGEGWSCWWTSPSVLIDDCEDAWNELVDADVTASLDTTDFQIGAGSAKFVCAANLAAGDIIATEAIASTDLSGCSHVSFRFKSTVALDAGDLQLLLDNTASCASPLETLNLPAIAANTWTKVDIALAAAASDTAIISVGLKMAVDKGAFTVNIDQITGEAYNEAMHDIIVSPASSGYAVYWDAGVNSYYIDIPRGIDNPDKITQSYATSGIFISPWFDAGNQTAAKLAKMLTDFAKGITTTETVALKYRLDHTYTDLDTGWTLLDTLNTTGESGSNEELFASGAGLSNKAIQYRLDFVTGGSTAKADIQSLVHYYKKRTGSEKLRVWDVTVICNDEHNTSAKQKVANLKTAIESATDVAFIYHSDGTINTTHFVAVNCPDFKEQSGLNYDDAEYKLRLIESKSSETTSSVAATALLTLKLGVLGASAWVIASNAPSTIVNFADLLQDAGYPVWLCDGTADNVQIQAAIDSLPSATGGEVRLSQGTFNTAVKITVLNPVTITGEGRAATIIDPTNDTFDAISLEPTSAWTEKGAKLADFKIAGGRYGVYLNTNAIKTTLENIDFFSQGDFGFYDAGAQNCAIYNSNFYNCGMSSASKGGIYLAGNSMQFYNTRVDACGTGIIIVAGYGSAFHGLYVEGNNYHGIVSDTGTLTGLTIVGLGMEGNNATSTANTYDIKLTAGSNVLILGGRITSTLVTKAIFSSIAYLGLVNVDANAVNSTITGGRGFIIGGEVSSDGIIGQGGRQWTNGAGYWWGGNSVEKTYSRLRNINDWTETAPAGGVVILRTVGGLDTDFTATQGAGDPEVFGVNGDSTAYAAYGQIQTQGKVTNLKVNGTVAIVAGDFLSTHTTRWIARKAVSGHTAFAKALTGYAVADNNGVIEALLIPPRHIV